MKILEVGMNKDYKCRLDPYQILLRTGVESDGSCFFHAFYYVFKEFRQLSCTEKVKYVKMKRKEIADKIQFEEWFLIQNGHMAIFQIISMMRIIVYLLPNLIHDPLEADKLKSQYHFNTELTDIFFNLIQSQFMDENMLPVWDIECTKLENQMLQKEILLNRMRSEWHTLCMNSVRHQIDELESDIMEYMNNEQKNRVIYKLSALSNTLFDYAVQKAFEDFKKEMEDPSVWVNIFHILSFQVFQSSTPFNILFIDSSTSLPLEAQRHFSFEKNRPFVVLLYFPDTHFESLAMKTKINHQFNINRIFPYDCSFIQKALRYLNKQS